jgi:hypothetical protein
MSPLEYGRASDYTVLDDAVLAWQDHRAWSDGVAFQVKAPWMVLIIMNCLTPGGSLKRQIRDVIGHIGGYWEFTRNRADIQGTLCFPQQQDLQGGVIAGHRAFLCWEGVCGVTGRGIPGSMGDPMETDQDALSAVLHQMVNTPSVGVAKSNARSSGSRPQQLKLFDG